MAKPSMNIRALRNARGLTLTELARRCDVSIALRTSGKSASRSIRSQAALLQPSSAAPIDDLYDMAAYGDTIMLYDDEPSLCRKEA